MSLNALRKANKGCYVWTVMDVAIECCKLADEIITVLADSDELEARNGDN